MIKLLQAGARRYFLSTIWWIAVAASVGFGLFFGDMMQKSAMFELSFYLFPLLVFATLIALEVGREIGDGAIRNKIISGHRRSIVYLSESILASAFCALLFVLFLAVFAAFNLENLSDLTLSAGISIFVGSLLISVTSAVLCVLIALLIHNRAVTAVVCIILTLVLAFVSNEIHLDLGKPEYTRATEIIYDNETGEIETIIGDYEKNPQYIGGARRKIYHIINYIIPMGQANEYTDILNAYIRRDSAPISFIDKEQRTALAVQPLYSLGVIAVILTAGQLLFRRRNMK